MFYDKFYLLPSHNHLRRACVIYPNCSRRTYTPVSSQRQR
jgi:hypothetical protein